MSHQHPKRWVDDLFVLGIGVLIGTLISGLNPGIIGILISILVAPSVLAMALRD